jgi:uncharacterized paraquat-inducible protein A
MILRCPKCKFAGAISETNRLTVDQSLFCPRCQTLIIYPDEQPRRVKWEARASWLDLAAFWQTSKNILFHPSATFTALNYEAGISSSLVYLLIYGSLGQIIGRYWFTLLGIQYGILDGNALNNTIRFGGTILFTPLLFLAIIFVAAGLIHFILRMLLAARRPFSATFQVVAYASGATSLFNVIPFVGRFIMPIWALVLSYVGLTKAHQTSRKRIFFALLLLLVIAGFSALGVFLVSAVFRALEVLEIIGQHL